MRENIDEIKIFLSNPDDGSQCKGFDDICQIVRVKVFRLDVCPTKPTKNVQRNYVEKFPSNLLFCQLQGQ